MTQKKVALVTGANKGLGLEISRQLAQQGIKVVMGIRNATKGRIAADQLLQASLDVEFYCLDVTKTESIKLIRDYLNKTYGKLDILVNNAGICLDRNQQPSEVSLDTIRKTFETNFFGVIAITQALLPLIQKSDAGRIVNMSSGRGSLTQHSDPQTTLKL
jgi:NAD(P)-dependent dehydrogenase (short-subunit alcohol dehydrogenase family)